MKFYTADELRNDPKWMKLATKRNLAVEVALMLQDARIKMGYTQAQLAKKIGTKQAGVARAESSKGFPSLATIEKIARAYKTNVVISFESMPDIKPVAVRYAKAKATVEANEGGGKNVNALVPVSPDTTARSEARAAILNRRRKPQAAIRQAAHSRQVASL